MIVRGRGVSLTLAVTGLLGMGMLTLLSGLGVTQQPFSLQLLHTTGCRHTGFAGSLWEGKSSHTSLGMSPFSSSLARNVASRARRRPTISSIFPVALLESDNEVASNV